MRPCRYDTRGFVQGLRGLGVTPHVAENTTNRRSAIDGRTTQHEGYAVSQRKRKRVEEVFGWLKTVALQRKTSFRGMDRVGWMFTLAAAGIQPGSHAKSGPGGLISPVAAVRVDLLELSQSLFA